LGFLDSSKMLCDLFGSEEAPHLRNKPRQLKREVRTPGRDAGEIQQLLANDIVEAVLNPEAFPDRLCRLALRNPYEMGVMCWAPSP
jgi:hypothetical protein